MADTITRYVNTASTAGGDGTTNNTSGANRAYATLAEWETDEQALQGDLVGNDRLMVVNCSGSAADTTNFTNITGWTTGVSNFITVNGDRTGAVYDTSAYRIEISPGVFTFRKGFDCDQTFTVVNRMQAKVIFGGTSNGHTAIELTGSGSRINESIAVVENSGTGSATGFTIGALSNEDYLATNCLAYTDDSDGIGFKTFGDPDDAVLHFCTGVGWNINYSGGTNATTAVDCLSQDQTTTGFSGTYSSASFCAVQGGSITGGSDTVDTIVLMTFQNFGANDYRPKVGETADDKVIEAGLLISGITTDLAGETRPNPPTIGCLEPEASSSVTGTGTAVAQSSETSGTGLIVPIGTGAAVAQSADASGVGIVLISGSGTAIAQDSQTSGEGTVADETITGSGAAVSQSSATSGAGITIVPGSGTAVAQSSETSGVGLVAVTGTGGAAAQDSQTSGVGSIAGVVGGSGGAVSQSSQTSGVGIVPISGSGGAQAQSSQTSGEGVIVAAAVTGTGSAVCQPSQTSGTDAAGPVILSTFGIFTPIDGTGEGLSTPITFNKQSVSTEITDTFGISTPINSSGITTENGI